jgi:predicted nucleic acid-binding protein
MVLLNGEVRLYLSQWRRRQLLELVWSPTLIGEFIRVMTEHEMDLAYHDRAIRSAADFKTAMRNMFAEMEPDYDVVQCLPEARVPRHVARNSKDAHTWWTAVRGNANFILTDDDASMPRPSDFDPADDLHDIRYIGVVQLARLIEGRTRPTIV